MTLTTDRAVNIALGNSRRAKVWKNKTMLWSEFADRLRTTTRTPETVAEYAAMSRAQQAEIKDCGGFVGGYLTEGSRTNVASRSMICLDADFADGELWADWGTLYGNAAAVYSTHKHTEDAPRLRLIIPLARDVSPEEYPAIGRQVAGALGINKFDDSTYDPGRLMYWPSTSQDGAYFYDRMDGPLLDPDAVLASYRDWRDISAWPTSNRVAALAQKRAQRQQDPHDKGGMVGAFCRAYTIQEAIAAFVPAYVPCTEANRYTYTGGSTAAGVVIYEDKFSYSHHATDPASGQLVNAWDLVRLHRFGELDAATDPDQPTHSRPSYKAMTQLAADDDRTRVQLVSDRTAEAAADYETEAPSDGEDWRARLRVTAQGGLAQTIENAAIILEHDPNLAGRLALNEMEHSIVTRGSLPWRDVNGTSQWTDADDAGLRYYLERVYGLSGKDRIYDATNVVAGRNAYHPVREYLESRTWDGVPRVATLLVDYLGAEDSAYTRAVTRKTLAAAVARVYRPGCKFDHMLTLRGRQGLGKSALIAKLGGEWFSDTFTTLQGKDAYEQVLGVWIMEVGELAGMRKAEAETIKLYISKQVDRYRPAYGRRLQEFPRQCIFVGTTNEAQFLRDTTGNRRFWVVDTPGTATRSIWDDLTPETVRQIWAEAVEIYKAGETLFLPADLEAVAREVQAAYEEENPRAGIVAEYLERKLPRDWDGLDPYTRRQWLETDAQGTEPRTTVCTLEIWTEALGGNPDRFDRYAGKEIRDIMASLPGWRYQGNKRTMIKPYGRQRYFKREGGAENG